MNRPHEAGTSDYQRRTRELEALFETAGDLSALRDVDQVLAAIVRRSRQLLGSDVAYLMLLDEERQEAYMRIGEGIQTPEFMAIRLAYGDGLGGLVAGTGIPQWTSDYQSDPRFAPSIESIVQDESLKAILGVPLKIGTRVTGVLFASDRRRRDFSHDDVALLCSLASHAAIALENASLFEASREASSRIERHNRVLERAAALHDKLTSLVLNGASLRSLTDVVAEAIGGQVLVIDEQGALLAPTVDSSELPDFTKHLGTGANTEGSVEITSSDGQVLRLASAQAGPRRLGYLVHIGELLPSADVRALERAALVTALLLLDQRVYHDARVQGMAELLTELATSTEMGEETVRQRAARWKLVVPRAPYVALVAIAQNEDGVADTFETATRLALEEGNLARVQGGEATFVIHGTDPGLAAKELVERLTALTGEPLVVGGAGPQETLVAAAGATTRARMCARVLDITGQWGRGATPEELGVYTLLFSDVGRGNIEDFVTETLGPIQAYDAAREGQLFRTLQMYFDTGGQTGQLAKELFIHVNTLYLRLERIDQLLGKEWRRGEQSLQVHLAVRLAGLLARQV